MIIDYTEEFKQHVRRLGRRYRSIRQDLQSLLDRFYDGDLPGDQMTGVGHPVYKVRVKNRDAKKGKSGGYRVIYYVQTEDHITLLAMYSKSDQADIGAETLRRILEPVVNP
jgi:mRNA-degrading endonuclease RelE of RelBE toxin-antitoxin system